MLRPIHGFWLVLSLAGMLGVSALHAQTVSADFGNRSGSTPVVPAGIFSAGGTGTAPVNSQSTIGLFTAAGIDRTRIWIPLDQVYATSTANFSYLDYSLQTISNAGLHPLGVIYNTPPSLGWSSCVAPSDYWQWGQMAASVVAHVDQKFPGLMRDYEIWNEPELQGSLCTGSMTSNLSAYVSMFAAAGQAMHTQATADGQVIHVGGPVISQLSQASTWIPALLNNGSTEPYVDFVSFHLYITGQNNIDSGMDLVSALFDHARQQRCGLLLSDDRTLCEGWLSEECCVRPRSTSPNTIPTGRIQLTAAVTIQPMVLCGIVWL